MVPVLVNDDIAVNLVCPVISSADMIADCAKAEPLIFKLPGTLTTSISLPRKTELLKLPTAPAPMAVVKVGAVEPGLNGATVAPLPTAVLLLPAVEVE